MDIIERLWNVSPDAGSGAVETLYLGGAVVLLLAVLRRKQMRVLIRAAVHALRRV